MKTPRSSSRSSQFGLIAWLENTRVALPLKGVECRFEVTGALASVELDQIYHQNADRALDCTYTFPLPAGAAVYRCELHVNGRVIRAKVEAKDEAQRIFQEQKAAGRRAALVETERENIFTLSLGNVQPEDVIVVRFAWFQMLDRSAEGLRLLVPTCLGVRYIPGRPLLRSSTGRGSVDDTNQVPDASRITPPRIDALHPDAAYFSLEGRLSSADVESGTLSSPSHALYVRENGDGVKVEISDHAAVPDSDLVLAWREPKARQLAPLAWRWEEAGATYALVQLRAPEGVQIADDFAQDVYFLVDRSGSMNGRKWQCTCEALRAFVGLLGAQDRVWITLFESGYQDFAEAPMPAPSVRRDAGFQGLEALGTGGGTELKPAALHVLEEVARHSMDRPTSVVLITDGQVGNDDEIIRAFQRVPHVRVHTFGIDTAVNDAFLRTLAKQQRGGCWLQTPNDNITATIAALGARLRRPVITDLTLGPGWEAGRDRLPDLYAEEVASIPLCGNGAHSLRIEGKLPSRETHALAVEVGTVGSEAVKLLWAKERIDTLLAANRQADAVALAKKYNLVCRGAAFIAWDEAEQVRVAEEEIVQPAMAPRQMMMALAAAPRGNWSGKKTQRLAMKASITPDCLSDASSLAQTVFSKLQPSDEPRADFDSLRASFTWAGIQGSPIIALLAWTKTNGQTEKLVTIQTVGLRIGLLRVEFAGTALAKYLESSARQAWNDSPEAVLKWCEEMKVAGQELASAIGGLKRADMPAELLEELVAWVWESGHLDRDRVHQLSKVAPGLLRRHFSAKATFRLWWQFIEKTMAKDSQVYAVAARCLRDASDSAAPVS